MEKQQKIRSLVDYIVDGTPQRVVANDEASKEPAQGAPEAATEPTAPEAATATPEVTAPDAQTAAPAASTQEAAVPDAKAEALLGTIDSPELRAALRAKQSKHSGRPRKDRSKEPPEERAERTTLMVNVQQWEKIKAISLRETLTLKEIVAFALAQVIERYEQKHGPISPEGTKPANINDIF